MNRSTSDEETPVASWEPCTAGKFATLVHQLQKRQRRRHFLHWTLAGSGVVVAGGIARWLCLSSGGQTEYHFAGMSCTEVLALAMAGKDQLEAGQLDQIRRHVARCPRCRPRLEEMGVAL